jgi:hypothetical protein
MENNEMQRTLSPDGVSKLIEAGGDNRVDGLKTGIATSVACVMGFGLFPGRRNT